MLTANNQNNIKIYAWEASKDEVFYCPECHNEVILKQGKIREHHFAHKVDADCPYRLGETELHLRIKREIYEALKNEPNCYRPELERVLNGVRPDISLFIGHEPVAIEIQRSDINVDLIIQRTTRYTQLGINLLWILPELNFDERNICRVKTWHQFLYRLQLERVYIWKQGAIVEPVHLIPHQIWKEQWEDWESGEVYGGYYHPSKTMRYPVRPNKEQLHIVQDFKSFNRSHFTADNSYIPSSKIWTDKLDRWWIDE